MEIRQCQSPEACFCIPTSTDIPKPQSHLYFLHTYVQHFVFHGFVFHKTTLWDYQKLRDSLHGEWQKMTHSPDHVIMECCQRVSQGPSAKAYIFQAQQDKKWNSRHSSLNPLLQRHSAITVIVNFFHHFMEDL